MYLSLILSAVAVYFLYKILLLLGTIATAPLLTLANALYRIYHPPNFPISYYVLGNGLVSLLTFPFEYAVWIVYKVIVFIALLPFNCLALIIQVLLGIFSLFNTVILSVIAVKLVMALLSIYYFRNMVFDNVPLKLSDFSLDGLWAFVSDWS